MLMSSFVSETILILTGATDINETLPEDLATTGHLKSVQTIYQALSDRPKGPKSPYYIQISGASALAVNELADKSRVPGSASNIIYNDLTDLESIKSLINQYPNRAVDNFMFSAAENSSVKTALVVPPMIYGLGRGPVNQRSIQIPSLVNATLKRQRGLQVGPGESRWSNIHVADLSRIFLHLVEKAVEGNEDGNVWGAKGLYFTGVGELVSYFCESEFVFLCILTHFTQSFGEISRRVTAAAHDLHLIPNREVDQIGGDEADELLPHGSVLFGTNAGSGAQRAERVLGWQPENDSLELKIPRAVAREAQSLRLQARGPVSKM